MPSFYPHPLFLAPAEYRFYEGRWQFNLVQFDGKPDQWEDSASLKGVSEAEGIHIIGFAPQVILKESTS